MNFQYAFDALRIRKGRQSIKEWCQGFGASPRYMTQIRNGSATPSIDFLSKVSKANDVMVWEIVKLAEEGDK